MKKKKISVIIADDHPLFRHGLFALLNSLDIVGEIQQASNGKEVLEILSSRHFDVVLMDIRMQPMDGIATTEIIKNRYKSKVIGLSMFSDRRYVLDMIQKGATGYILKNAETEEIIKALETVMNGGKFFSEQILVFTNIAENRPNKKQNKYTAHEEKLNQIIYLLCHEKTSKEIADIMNLSKRTIDEYRQEITNLSKSKNLAGVIKYAIEHGILDDEIIKNKLFPKI
ncbi:MAG: DNA-binding response regulator [Bacteroidetes bacterium]|nr:MAG: DNA-binding response regulator [Bacteroidota bacterium]REK06562.1 MAG: DNA-binding response regulator [Bacteroidota bacterium]REK33328.1 MAG: DNA-binding response regulator [Bacteroidota bacterium]REK49728.1 MAG: DNA-binding response regulator [Bacteroidota bacterium]